MRPQLLKNILHRQRERRVLDRDRRDVLSHTTATLNKEYDDLNDQAADLTTISRDEYLLYRSDFKERVHQYNIDVMMHKYICDEYEFDTNVRLSTSFDEIEDYSHDYEVEDDSHDNEDEDNEDEDEDENENFRMTTIE